MKDAWGDKSAVIKGYVISTKPIASYWSRKTSYSFLNGAITRYPCTTSSLELSKHHGLCVVSILTYKIPLLKCNMLLTLPCYTSFPIHGSQQLNTSTITYLGGLSQRTHECASMSCCLCNSTSDICPLVLGEDKGQVPRSLQLYLPHTVLINNTVLLLQDIMSATYAKYLRCHNNR